MAGKNRARAAGVAALLGICFVVVGCGNSIEGTSSQEAPGAPRAASGMGEQRAKVPEADVLLLADQLELDLRLQGIPDDQARAIAQGGVQGTQGSVDALGLVDLKSFLPGFLKGALGVAKTLFAGTPVGVAGTIIESIVKGVSKQPATPKDVLRTLPALALETLKPKQGGVQDMLLALLAAGRGVSAGASPDDARGMMESLVTALARQPGMGPEALALLLPALQENLQARLALMPLPQSSTLPQPSTLPPLPQGPGSALPPGALPVADSPLAGLLAAVSEGQFNALLGLRTPQVSERDRLVSLLLQRGAESLMTKVGVKDEALRLELLQALAAGAARPLGSLDAVAKETKQDMLQALAGTLTRSVLDLKGQVGPLKQQALEATLLGLSRGMLSTKAVSDQELSEVFARVSQALGRGVVSQPGSDDAARQMLLSALGQASVRVVDTARDASADLKKQLLASALRGLASGVSTATPQSELVEVLLAVLNARAARPAPPPMPTTEDALLALLQATQRAP